MHYEYKLVPAPRKGRKTKGIKGVEARFAYVIQTLMNDMAADGWEFQRAETLPSEERQGLTSSHVVYRDLLVFRRARAADETPVNPVPLALGTDLDTAQEDTAVPDQEHYIEAEDHWHETEDLADREGIESPSGDAPQR